MKSPKNFKVLLVYPNLTMMLVPSLAIALFTGLLKKQGYEVDLFDTTHYVSEEKANPEFRQEYLQHRPFNIRDLGVNLKDNIIGDFVKKVDEFKPDLLVVSVVEDTFIQACEILEAVEDAKIPHIIGGVFITAAPEVAISYPQVQMIGLGEGEETLVEVAERIRRSESCEDVQNVWMKRPDGSVIKNQMRPLVDINKPWPDFSLFDEARFYRPMGGRIFKTVPLETYRGCPYSCTFCNSPMQVEVMRENKLGSFLRRKRIDGVREEIKYLVDRYEPEYLYFIDDSFLARPQAEIVEFMEMYKEFKLPFWCNTRPENVTEERLEMMKSVNADRVSYGLECGNEQFRKDIIKRNPTNEDIIRQFDLIARGGIAFSVNNIIGFPDENRELIFETIELNRQLWGYDSLSVSIFTPYHGTHLRELAIERGYLEETAMTKHVASSSILNMPQLSSKEIDGLLKTFQLYVRMPKDDWPMIRKAEENSEDGNRVFAEFQDKFTKTYLAGTQDDAKAGWNEPTEYVVAPKSEQPQEKEDWGFNCGAEQREYVVPPRGTGSGD